VGKGLTNTSMVQTPAATKNLSAITWWIWYRPIASLDPVKYNDYPEDLIIPNMCESLAKQVPGRKTVPDLATSWTQPNLKTLLINIRKGVKFWDGKPMTGADVLYSLRRNLVAANQSIYAYVFGYVKSMTLTGPYTLKVTFSRPNLTFMPEMAALGGAVVEKAYAQKAASNFGTPKGGVMCTGPYKLTSWDGVNSLVMTRNPNYWNKALTPKTDKFTFVWPQDPGQVGSAFQTGQFAGGFDILPTDVPVVQKLTNGNFYVGPESQAMEIEALIVVGTQGAITNPNVRQALEESIARAQMAKAVFAGVGFAAYADADPGYWSYDQSAYQAAYNKLAAAGSSLAHAKALVKQAGPAAKGPIVLAIQGGSQTAADEGAVIQQGAASVGLNVKLRTVSDAQYGALFSDPAARKGFDLIETTNYDQDPDPLALYADIALPNAVSNFNSYDNKPLIKTIQQALATTNLSQRAALTTQAQAQVMKDLPWIPLLFIPDTAFVRKGICGVTLDFSQMTGPWAASVGGC
jgi:peptide/nickel transport system substrate-binding protein